MHAKLDIVPGPTPLVRAARLSEALGVDLFIKRDDVAGPSFGGNKARQLEYYFGDAIARNADTILITGAVQSNFARLAAAVAKTQGMRAIVQLEDRVPGQSDRYLTSGNVLLSRLIEAELISYPEEEDEVGADAALNDHAEVLRAKGRTPYVIPLSEGHPPLGALGYVDAARELLGQGVAFDFVVVASGSGATHAGLLAGLKGEGSTAQVIGSCVRRPASQQAPRLRRVMDRLALLYDGAGTVRDDDILLWDGALAPGYGRVGEAAWTAMRKMASFEGLILDPVYTSKSFAAVLALVESGEIGQGARVCFVHTGGLAALFAYDDTLLPRL